MGSFERLRPVDAAWFRMDERSSPADIAAVMRFGGSLTRDRLGAVLGEKLLVHERFKERVVDSPGRLAPPHWEPEADFTLDAHLTSCTLEGEESFGRFVDEAMSTPFDFTRSPWRIVVIDGLAGGTVLFVHVHHCMGDGFALLEILTGLADEPAHVARSAPPPAAPRARTMSVGVGAGALALARVLALSFDPPSPLRGQVSGARVAAWSRPLSVERIKALAHREGASLNDVVMTALTGAIRSVMLDVSGEAPPLRAVVPVNLRARGEPVDLAHGNWFGLAFVDLPAGETSRADRLRALHAAMQPDKRGPEAWATLAVLALLGRAPIVIDRAIEALFARKATLVATNVPGPKERLTVAGVPLTDLYFWVPHPCGLACGASVLSYAGRLRVGVRSDRAVLPNPGRVVEAFVEELEAWNGAPVLLES